MERLAVRVLTWQPLSVALFWLLMTLLALPALFALPDFVFLVSAVPQAACVWLGVLAWPLGIYWLVRRGQPKDWNDVVIFVSSVGLPISIVATAAYAAVDGPTPAIFDIVAGVVAGSVVLTFAFAADALVTFESTSSPAGTRRRFWTFIQMFYLPIGVFFLRARVNRLLIARGVATERFAP